jgi:uncharacterized protein
MSRPVKSKLVITRRKAAAFLRNVLLSRPKIATRKSKVVADIVRDLELVQMDPVRVVGRNHDLVLHNRIDDYRPADYESALSERLVFEYRCGNRSILPIEDYPNFVPSMKARISRLKERLDALGAASRQVLSALDGNGPLPSRVLESDEKVAGYWDAHHAPKTKATSHALQLLWDSGRVVAAERRDGEIYFDLPERFFSKDLLAEGKRIKPGEAERFLIMKYYRAYRLFDAGHSLFGFSNFRSPERKAIIEKDLRRGILALVQIEGVKRPYYCLAADSDRLLSTDENQDNSGLPKARILSPLDNILWRRERLQDIAGFDYRWEIYTPLVRRRYGPYTMPLLYGNTIPLRVDLKFDAEQNAIRVRSLFWESHVIADERSEIIAGLCSELGRLKIHLGASAVRWHASRNRQAGNRRTKLP